MEKELAMASFPPFVVDAEEMATLDDSTAPTTPDGSSSFSPELRPQVDPGHLNVNSLPAGLFDAALATPLVRNICCIGAGFVGGPTAAVIALQNPHIRVTVVDRDERRIRRWNSKHPPIYEPGLNDILRIARDGVKESVSECGGSDSICRETASSESGSPCESHRMGGIKAAARQPNLVFTTDVAKCVSEADVVLIAVNTPTKKRGKGAGSATDMAAFEAVVALVAQHASPGAIIVEKSTVPCRTAQLVQDTLALYRPGVPFEVLSNPEFLAAGTAVNDLLHADRILIGSNTNTPSGRRAAAALASVYASWIPPTRIITTNLFSSELAKLVANSMLAQRISSINSIAAVCDATGADVDEVAAAVGADPRIGPKFLRAGIGFGGSCFKKDVLSLVYLAETLSLPEVAAYWRAVVDMNEFARNRFVARAIRALNNTLAGKKVAVLGFAFKKDTNDTRESPALDIVRTLEEEGPAEIAVYDPLCIPGQMAEEIGRFAGPGVLRCNGGPVEVYADVYAACRGADAVLITTEFDEFRNGPVEAGGGGGGDASGLQESGQAGGGVGSADLRPLVAPNEPSMNHRLLVLHSNVGQSGSQESPPGQVSIPDAEDYLSSLNAAPSCDEDCPDCRLEEQGASSTASYKAGAGRAPKARVDWTKIYYHMKRPHLVLDGRGVLDIASIERIGFRVESIGRQSRMKKS